MALQVPARHSGERQHTAGKRVFHNGYRQQPFGFLLHLLPRPLAHDERVILQHIREGRFQRSLALITAFSGLLSGLEVTYEHYIGSYSQRIMYTPVLASLALVVTSIGGVFNRWMARVALPIVSLVTALDGLVGFFLHMRGVERKPGG